MTSRIWSIGALVMVAAVGVDAAEKRPTAEQGGLFSLFTRGDEEEKPEAEAEEPAEPEAAAAEAPPPAEESVAVPTAEPAPEAPSTTAEEKTGPEAAPAAAAKDEAAPPSEAEPATATKAEPEPDPEGADESPSVAAPAAPAATDEPAWPSAPDSGGTLAEQPTAMPQPEGTPEPSVAAIEPPAESVEPESAPAVRGTEEAIRARQAKPEIAAREVPSGGSFAPGAVALPEAEIQGEIEKPDIFFLLPKARDQSDDQVIRARIRREITQPLVKEWLEEMMLLK
jgi:hypothetical protein